MELIASIDELASVDRISVVVDDIPALLVRDQEEYLVIEDLCSHDGQPLTDGAIVDGSIACPRHGARFDLKTGDALCMPATRAIRTFQVEIRDSEIWAAPSAPSRSTAPTSAGDQKASEESTMPATQQAGATSTVAADPETDQSPDSAEPSTEGDYIEALKQVIDPELMINIVDLGLIYSVSQDENESSKVAVEMTLTSPACPAGPQIVQQAKMALERLHDVTEAVITMTMSPPWTPERMTDDARDQLGIF